MGGENSEEKRVLRGEKLSTEWTTPGKFPYGICRKLKWSINEPYQAVNETQMANTEKTPLRNFDQAFSRVTRFPSLQQHGINDCSRERMKTKMKSDIGGRFHHKEELPKIISLNH